MRPGGLSACLALALAGCVPAEPVVMRGVNLAGGEFYAYSKPASIPGAHGVDYQFPDPASLDYYRRHGVTLIRLPFLWERVQPTLNGPLDPTEMARIDRLVQAIQACGMRIILEAHNRGYRYFQAPGARRITIKAFYAVGSAKVPRRAFQDFWRRFAEHYRNQPSIYAFGLSDEPHGLGILWSLAAQAGLNGIREVDRRRAVMVGCDGWSSSWAWKTNSRRLNVRDPEDRLIYEASVFFDKDGSGYYPRRKDAHGAWMSTYESAGADPWIGVRRVKPFIDWLSARKARGFIAGYGAPYDDRRWLEVIDNFLRNTDAHRVSTAWWAGGTGWPADYPMSLEPFHGLSRPPMAILARAPRMSGPAVYPSQPAPGGHQSDRRQVPGK